MDQNTVGAASSVRQRLTVLIVGTVIASVAFGIGSVALFMQGENGRALFYAGLCLVSIVLGVRTWKDRQKIGMSKAPDQAG